MKQYIVSFLLSTTVVTLDTATATATATATPVSDKSLVCDRQIRRTSAEQSDVLRLLLLQYCHSSFI